MYGHCHRLTYLVPEMTPKAIVNLQIDLHPVFDCFITDEVFDIYLLENRRA